MRKKEDFTKGLLNGLPICFGYLSVSFAFGIFAVSCGLSISEAVLISAANVTSAGQLAAIPIITGGGSLVELAISQLVINLRYALMSISLSQKLDRNVTLGDRLLISFVNTDEVFALASSQPGSLSKWYLFGLILTPFLGWSFGTFLGAVAGNLLPASVISALGLAIYGMFIAIILPAAKKHRPTAWCVLISVALSCAFRFIPPLNRIPSGFSIILCAVAASALMAVLRPVEQEANL